MKIEANQKIKREKQLKEGNDIQNKEFDIFYNEIKKDPKIKAVIRPYNREWDIFADCYYTARLAGQSNKSAQRFAKSMFWDYVNNGRKNEITDPQLKTLFKKYTGKADINFKKRSQAFIKLKQKERDNQYIDWNEWDKEIQASDTPYVNKSSKVKAVFYENRSTPELVKPGQEAKPKQGYGKQTKVRDLTEDELNQAKAGKWIRTREDNKKHSDLKAKVSKYRPQLGRIQKAARKRKLTASNPSNRYKNFIKELFNV